MRQRTSACSLIVLLALASGRASAGDPKPADPGYLPSEVPVAPAEPERLTAEPIHPGPYVFGPTAIGCSTFPQTFTPQMIGDFLGYRIRQRVLAPTLGEVQTLGGPPLVGRTAVLNPANGDLIPVQQLATGALIGRPVTITVPVANRSGFKIAENESPRPTSRVFVNYGYFDHVEGVGTIDGSSRVIGLDVKTGNLLGLTSGPVEVGGPNGDVHREVFGFEYAMMGGAGSVGLRAPVFHHNADGSFNEDDFGDLSFILKYAVVNNVWLGNILSVGMVVTVPTGPDIVTIDGTLNSTLLQPFVGGIFNQGSMYVQGFSSLVVPTASEDVPVLFTDIGLGYYLQKYNPAQAVSFVAPTFEVHVTTPLDNHKQDEGIFVPDIVVFTAGAHIGVGAHGILTGAFGFPVTGPQPFDVQAVAQFNFRF